MHNRHYKTTFWGKTQEVTDTDKDYAASQRSAELRSWARILRDMRSRGLVGADRSIRQLERKATRIERGESWDSGSENVLADQASSAGPSTTREASFSPSSATRVESESCEGTDPRCSPIQTTTATKLSKAITEMVTRSDGRPRTVLSVTILMFLREHLGTHDISDLSDMLADRLHDLNFFDRMPGEFYPTPHFRAHETHKRRYDRMIDDVLRAIDDRICDAIDEYYERSPYYDSTRPLQLRKLRTLAHDAPAPRRSEPYGEGAIIPYGTPPALLPPAAKGSAGGNPSAAPGKGSPEPFQAAGQGSKRPPHGAGRAAPGKGGKGGKGRSTNQMDLFK